MVYPLEKAHRVSYENSISLLDKQVNSYGADFSEVSDKLMEIAKRLENIEANLEKNNQLYEKRVEWIKIQEDRIEGIFDNIIEMIKNMINKLLPTYKYPTKMGG